MSSIKLKFGGVCRRLFLETPDFGALVQHINTCVFSHAPPSFRLTYNDGEDDITISNNRELDEAFFVVNQSKNPLRLQIQVVDSSPPFESPVRESVSATEAEASVCVCVRFVSQTCTSRATTSASGCTSTNSSSCSGVSNGTLVPCAQDSSQIVIPRSQCTLQHLRTLAAAHSVDVPLSPFTVKYLDDEGDWVSLIHDEDLSLALQLSIASLGGVLTLSMHPVMLPSATAGSACNLSASLGAADFSCPPNAFPNSESLSRSLSLSVPGLAPSTSSSAVPGRPVVGVPIPIRWDLVRGLLRRSRAYAATRRSDGSGSADCDCDCADCATAAREGGEGGADLDWLADELLGVGCGASRSDVRAALRRHKGELKSVIDEWLRSFRPLAAPPPAQSGDRQPTAADRL